MDRKRVAAAKAVIAAGRLSPADAIRHLLTPKQREGFDAVIAGRNTAALWGRRAGKTSLIAAVVAWAGFTSRKVVLLYPSEKQAHKRSWGRISTLAKGLGLAVRTLEKEATIYVGSGSVEIGSAHTASAVEGLRGADYDIAIVDEPGSIDDDLLTLAMDDVVGPALMDRGGTWLLCGTPGPIPMGRWFDVSAGQRFSGQWTRIHGTYLDNPTLKDPEKHIDGELARMGKTRESDTYLREYLAQWVASDAERPLHWTPANDYQQLPTDSPALRVLGIDIGFSDADALAMLFVWRGAVYLIAEDETAGQTTPKLADKIKQWTAIYRPHIIVADSAAAKTIADLQAAGIPVQGAKKGRGSVAMGLRQLDDLLKEARYFAKVDSRFVADAAVIRWDEPGKTLKKQPHSNIIPAAIYALDVVSPYLLTPAPPVPPEAQSSAAIYKDPLFRAMTADPNPDRPDYR